MYHMCWCPVEHQHISDIKHVFDVSAKEHLVHKVESA